MLQCKPKNFQEITIIGKVSTHKWLTSHRYQRCQTPLQILVEISKNPYKVYFQSIFQIVDKTLKLDIIALSTDIGKLCHYLDLLSKTYDINIMFEPEESTEITKITPLVEKPKTVIKPLTEAAPSPLEEGVVTTNFDNIVTTEVSK